MTPHFSDEDYLFINNFHLLNRCLCKGKHFTYIYVLKYQLPDILPSILPLLTEKERIYLIWNCDRCGDFNVPFDFVCKEWKFSNFTVRNANWRWWKHLAKNLIWCCMKITLEFWLLTIYCLVVTKRLYIL